MQGLQTGFNRLGKAAGQAIDETRIQVELMGARRRKDAAARDLGYLVYRVTQGATTLPGEQDAIVKRIADIEKQIEKLGDQVRGQAWKHAYVFFKDEGEGRGPKYAAQFLELSGADGA